MLDCGARAFDWRPLVDSKTGDLNMHHGPIEVSGRGRGRGACGAWLATVLEPTLSASTLCVCISLCGCLFSVSFVGPSCNVVGNVAGGARR